MWKIGFNPSEETANELGRKVQQEFQVVKADVVVRNSERRGFESM